MAKNKNQTKPTKTPKPKKNLQKLNLSKSVKKNKKNVIKKIINDNVGDEIVTNNGSVLELMTTHPELSQTFEYILYSNKYKHTLTDVFNIIKMLMSKLEELQKHNVDLKNIFETINLNYKIKGLVQSTAINLSHVVEQLNVNESTFLNFARTFTPLKIINDSENVTENTIPSSTSTSIPDKSFVSNSPSCSYNYQSPPEEEVKYENPINANIFGCNTIVLLSSDDEFEESNLTDGRIKSPATSKPIKIDQDLENYVIGSDIKDILSDSDNSNSNVNFPATSNQENNLPKVSSNRATVQKTKKSKPKLSDETVNEARKSDLQLRKRLSVRNSEMLNLINTLNLQPNEIVLEFDAVKKKPAVTIHKELAKVLKKHQVEGIRFIWNTVFETIDRTNSTDGTGCILAHRMGVGKTLQVITLMYSILCQSQLNIKTFLIICPPGLIYNWMDEIYKWLKDIDNDNIIKVYDLPKTNKLYNITNIATWKSKGGILILSYENFKSLVNCKQSDLQEAFSHTLINPGPDVVILDEGHYIKNTNTVLLKSLSKIRTKRRIVLTGTPIQNSLKEYFTMVDFVKPNILGNFGDFSTIFIKPIDSGQFIDSSDESVKIMKQRTFILHKLLQNTVHRIDDRNLKPLFTEKIEYTIEVNMTEFQCELYEHFLNYSKTSNDKCNVFLRLHVLTLITLHPLTLYRLVHYRNGKQPEFGTAAFDNKLVKDLTWIADYGDDPRFFEAKQSNKIMYLLNTIAECQKRNEKVLCFLKSPLALDALEYFLQQEKKWIFGEDYLRMDGKTPLTVRNQMCEAFNNPESCAKLFILSMGTGVLGYNMVGANRVLLLSTSWNPSNDLQAIYRCLRFGQKKTVYVNRLLAKGTVEPKTYYRQISKLGMASSVVDLQLVNRKVSYDQTNDLFTFDSSRHRFTSVKATKDPVLNALMRRNTEFVSDLKEHDSMLVESVEDQLSVEERKAVWLSFKNKELGIKSLIKPIPLYKLKNSEQHNKTSIANEDSIPEINKNCLSSSSLQSEEQQMSTQNANQNHGSRFLRYFNCPKPAVSPSFSRTHTKFTDTAEESTNYDDNLCDNRNRWKNDEPSIQNQFRNFQNKTFSHHKRYPVRYNHPNSFDKTPSRNSQYQNQQPYYHGNQSLSYYPNRHRTPIDKNIQNRSGMYK